MKNILLALVCICFLSGCSLLKGKVKTGCRTDGKNVGAEKILSGDIKSAKAARKAKKFNS